MWLPILPPISMHHSKFQRKLKTKSKSYKSANILFNAYLTGTEEGYHNWSGQVVVVGTPHEDKDRKDSVGVATST